ncbi:MAG TPA: MoxR family ATPase [Bryobacteraceae bacterium]|jgi:MoxR-like ATPase|nr:MoxR family ATPase [Bryobacteraceae bacterium]
MSSFPATLATRTAPGKLQQVENAIGLSVRGKAEAVRMALVCLLARGHLLIEDVPGVGKTTLAQSMARTVDGAFHRLQFTSDMLPSDVLGVTVYNAHTEEFEFKPGPVFTNFLLADEINRTTPKTQSALLEAMNEQQVSIEGRTLPLPEPFMVIATQNPADHHGTYPLPESQLDRFLMRLRIGYPDAQSEREIIRQTEGRHGETTPCVLDRAELRELQCAVTQIPVDESIVDYMLALIERTRSHEGLALGVSPRGSQALYRAVQANALVEGRGYALPDDVKVLAPKVLGHRVTPAAKSSLAARRDSRGAASGERIIEEILAQIEVPL